MVEPCGRESGDRPRAPHRQDKPVFVHRLIALGTIEEKMEALKARKQALVVGILNAEAGATLMMTEADSASWAPRAGDWHAGTVERRRRAPRSGSPRRAV
jgi:hypothetical protein